MKVRRLLGTLLTVTLLCGQAVTANAADVGRISQLNFEAEGANLQNLSSDLMDDEIQYEFTESTGDEDVSALAETRRAANKYMWSHNTYAYDFSWQTWSSNREIYNTYPKNSEGFAMGGFLLNPKGPADYNTALREGYLNDSAYAADQGHFYQNVVSSEGSNYVTFMLESNAYVFIFDNDLNLIYRSTDEAGVTSYFTSYYSTKKTIAGNSNKVICLGLTTGNYYFVFKAADDAATSGFHYGFYSGQPLPIAQTTSFSDPTHYAAIKWDNRSMSQTVTTQTLTITCPSGTATEYALTGVKFIDKSKSFANNTYASSIDYYYTPATAGYSIHLTQTGGWWSDLVDTTPPSGSIDGSYATKVTVHWVDNISYINARCTTMTQMTLDYLVPFGIIVG